MPLPLIVKAAILGGAAYAATRWLAAQQRARRTDSEILEPERNASPPTELHPGQSPWAVEAGSAPGPTS
jgi:hypothetical protein